jgi:hypothetical protein
MSLAYKLFLTFLYVRSAAIVNTGQPDLSREKNNLERAVVKLSPIFEEDEMRFDTYPACNSSS